MSFVPSTGMSVRLNPVDTPIQPSLLVGIQRDPCPPFSFGGARLQRMRVIIVESRQCGDPDSETCDRREETRTELLPHLPAAWNRVPMASPRPRPILGEILRGEDGALYERFGRHIRSLERLVSGPNGEVLEVVDQGDPSSRRATREPDMVQAHDGSRGKTAQDSDGTPAESRPEAPVPGYAGNSASASTFLPLFPEPGQWRVVRLADFKQMLLPQLAQPDRLRDTHHLPCYVQVFEVTAPQRPEAMAETLFGDASAARELRSLTSSALRQLQLAPLLPPPSRVPRSVARQPGMLVPGDRLFYLEVANDPTAASSPDRPPGDANHRCPSPGQTMGKLGSPDDKEADRVPSSSAQTSDPASPPTPATPPSAGPAALKTGVPAGFIRPWEFRFNREEALYESIRARSLWRRILAAAWRWCGGWHFTDELRRWPIMMTGKTLDEQLWSVCPPKGGLRHPQVTAWVERTLEAAGYDTRAMLIEWEIHWRRKGR